jgi:hypothetical protein
VREGWRRQGPRSSTPLRGRSCHTQELALNYALSVDRAPTSSAAKTGDHDPPLSDLHDGQFAHTRHAKIARRAIVPQAGGIARNPKSAASFACPASIRGAYRDRHGRWERDAVDALAVR